ncbi:hypothetical protein BGZ67_001724 [Mortierella alpina]|nr:hypothetical protein BGZ67_001724 [Mortierella alpina]
MSISIDGGPIEGIFGSQLEQRVVSQASDQDDGIGHRRRHSEGRDSIHSIHSIHSTAEARLLNPPSPGLAPSSWLAWPWRTRHAHKAHKPLRNSFWSWWPPRLLSSSVSPRVSRTLGHTGSFVADRIQHLQIHAVALFAASITNNKRRKSWFLTLLLVSLALTVFSGGFLLNQLHHQRDLAPQPVDSFVAEDGTGLRNAEPGTSLDGPRRDRNRGKKHRVPKTKPAGQTEKGKTIPATPVDTPQSKGNATKEEEEGEEKMKPKVDIPTELDSNSSSDDALDIKKDIQEQGIGAPQGTPNTTSTGAPVARICSLEDVASGRWVYSKMELAAGSALDMTWTGYGPKGCRSNIWNERYLLTPSPTDNATSTTTASTNSQSMTQRDLEYARQLKRYHWQLNTSGRSSGSKDLQETGKTDCKQPPMDVIDLVEVLKRSPLVMIGDKFLEQEFLTLECMIMGMQDQHLVNSRPGSTNKQIQEEEEEEDVLDYLIEVKQPDVVELKIAPAMSSQKDAVGSASTSAMRRPAIYRKAKPGQMRLVDRLSNTTLITFVRSDILWDSDMMTGQVAKHGLKSVAEFSALEAGGLHPDCKLAGSVVLCEPARLERRERTSTQEPSEPSSVWSLWGGLQGGSVNVLEGDEDVEDARHQHEDSEAGEMAFGSDLERDMINLEWVRILEDIVRDSAAYVEKALQGQSQANAATAAAAVERKPMVLISNGHVWEYDPEDAIDDDQRGNGKLSKVEQDVRMRTRQEKRRKQLRQRYAMVLSNTLDYIKSTHPDMRVMVQSSVRRRSPCESGSGSVEAQAIRDMKDEEAALLNALTKTVVARMQDPLYSFLDTTFLRLFEETMPDKHHCDSFMMPGPLDTLVHQLYGELYRLDL